MKIAWLSEFLCGGLMVVGGLYLLYSLIFVVLLSACGSESTENSGGESTETVSVTQRLTTVTATYSSGDVDIYNYTYSEQGQLLSTEIVRNGTLSSRLTYTYTEGGLTNQRGRDTDLDGVSDFSVNDDQEFLADYMRP